MIMLLIFKTGIIIPIKLPSDKTPDFLFQEIIEAEVAGFFSAREAKSGDEIMVRVSEIIALQLTDETKLQRNVLMPTGGRIQ